MQGEHRGHAGKLLIGLPVLSNLLSFIIFAPLLAPGRAATAADFRRAGILLAVGLLVVEATALLTIALSLHRRNRSLMSVVNLHPNRLPLYVSTGLLVLVPTLAAGWLYSLAQAQTGMEAGFSRLSQGDIAYWYVLMPVAAAFLEETIWRGYAIPRTRGRWRALLFSSLSFALFHGIFNPLAVAATLLQGLVWGWTYQRTESTMPSMALHFLSRYLILAF